MIVLQPLFNFCEFPMCFMSFQSITSEVYWLTTVWMKRSIAFPWKKAEYDSSGRRSLRTTTLLTYKKRVVIIYTSSFSPAVAWNNRAVSGALCTLCIFSTVLPRNTTFLVKPVLCTYYYYHFCLIKPEQKLNWIQICQLVGVAAEWFSCKTQLPITTLAKGKTIITAI